MQMYDRAPVDGPAGAGAPALRSGPKAPSGWSLPHLLAAVALIGGIVVCVSHLRSREQRRRRAVPTLVLKNAQGVEVHVSAAGAAIQRVLLPDKDGTFADVVLGFDSTASYVDGSNPYLGVVVGRCANRIAKAAFSLGGRIYSLTPNDPPNSLHGGLHGWGEKIWEAKKVRHEGHPGVLLTYRSPSGDEGYPGNLVAEVLYVLSDGSDGSIGCLRCMFSATTDAPSPINMAQHSYWNLKGHASGTILDHTLSISADQYTPLDNETIPNGQLADVAGTAFDFRNPQPIGLRIGDVPGGGGYDHNFVLRRSSDPSGRVQSAAVLKDEESGRSLHISTNAPGLQLYSGNFLDGSVVGKGKTRYARHCGVALETQAFPNSINTPSFPSVILLPGDTYSHEVSYTFGR